MQLCSAPGNSRGLGQRLFFFNVFIIIIELKCKVFNPHLRITPPSMYLMTGYAF